MGLDKNLLIFQRCPFPCLECGSKTNGDKQTDRESETTAVAVESAISGPGSSDATESSRLVVAGPRSPDFEGFNTNIDWPWWVVRNVLRLKLSDQLNRSSL